MVARRFIVPAILVLAAGAGLAAGLVLQERSVGLNGYRGGTENRAATGAGPELSGPADFVLDLGELPAAASAGTEVSGSVVARDRHLGDPIAGMRLRWSARAHAVEIARGEGTTSEDGALAVAFRARVGGSGREPRIWADSLELRAVGQDDLGRPVEATCSLALDAPRTPQSPHPLQPPRAPQAPQSMHSQAAGVRASLPVPGLMRVGDRATLRGIIVNGTVVSREVAGLLDASGVEVEGALRRSAVLAPGASTPLEWPVTARAAGQARAWLTARSPGMASQPGTSSHGGGTWTIGPVGRQIGQAWVGGLESPASITVAVPPEALPDTVALAVTVAGSAGGAAVAAAHGLAQEPADGPDGLAATLLSSSAALSTRPEGRIASDLRSGARKALGELAAMQNPDGGWGPMPGGASRLDVTAFALRALESGGAAGLSLENAARYIRELEPQEPEDAAMALWALGPQASLALRDRAWGKVRRMGSAGLARLTSGMARAGDSRSLAALSQLDQRIREETGLAHWQSGLAESPGSKSGAGDPDVEATALAISARLALDPRDSLAQPAIRWLLRSRHGERWPSDRSTALAIQALADAEAAIPVGAGAAGRVSVFLDGKERGRLVGHGGVPARMVLTAADLPAGTHMLALRVAGGIGRGWVAPAQRQPARLDATFSAGASGGPDAAPEVASFTATLRYMVPERKATATLAPDAELRIRREYFAVPANRLARAGGVPLQDLLSAKRLTIRAAGGNVPVNGVVIVRLTLTTRRDLKEVQVTDPIPAGAAPIALPAAATYHRTGSAGETRILAAPAGRGEHVFYHAFRPRIAGSFVVPGPVAQTNGAPGMRARGAASRLDLVR